MIMKNLTAALMPAALFTLPAVSVSANVPGVQPRLIPLTDFFRNPEAAHYTISPDGEHIAFLKPCENRLNVYVRRVR